MNEPDYEYKYGNPAYESMTVEQLNEFYDVVQQCSKWNDPAPEAMYYQSVLQHIQIELNFRSSLQELRNAEINKPEQEGWGESEWPR